MKIIVAADKNWGIGKDGQLLCHLPGDLKYFKEKTTGKIVVMGRKTLESLPGGRPLPNRTNVILTRNKNFEKEGCITVAGVKELFSVLESLGENVDVMIIGGGDIYRQLLPYCNACYVTKLIKEFDADTYFPNLDESTDFKIVWQSEKKGENGIEYVFTEYRRL